MVVLLVEEELVLLLLELEMELAEFDEEVEFPPALGLS